MAVPKTVEVNALKCKTLSTNVATFWKLMNTLGIKYKECKVLTLIIKVEGVRSP